jgi:D-amino peptidase
LAGHFGIPVCLVAGDDTVAQEAREVNPGVTTVTVKRALASLPPTRSTPSGPAS